MTFPRRLAAAGLLLMLAAAGCQSAPLLPVATSSSGFKAPLLDPQAYKARSAERFYVIDTRGASSYAAEHIEGAANVTPDTLAALAPSLPRDRPLLLYCTCDDEGLSLKVAGMLHDQYGFTNLQVLHGGLAAWKDAGLPVTTAPASPAPSPSAAPATLANVGFVDLPGNASSLEAFRGKYVLLTLFATWCPHCQVMLPRLQAFYDRNKRADYVWLPLEASAGTRADVEAFVKTYGITAPVYLDPTNKVGPALGVTSFPTDYLLGPDGAILASSKGELSDADLEQKYRPQAKGLGLSFL